MHQPESESASATSPIVYVTRAPLETLHAVNVALLAWLRRTPTRPTYLLILKSIGNERLWTTPDRMLSSAKAIYAQTGVAFSVLSAKKDRICLCASLSSETTKSPAPSPSPDGSGSSSRSQSPSGPEAPPTGAA